MGKIFAFGTQKGGTGKTTMAHSVACGLVRLGRERVLIVDCDSQGDLTKQCFGRKATFEQDLFELLEGSASLEDVVVPWQDGGEEDCSVDIIPCNISLTVAWQNLRDQENGDLALRSSLQGAREVYDAIIIDSPPSISFATTNILNASDFIVLVMDCEQKSLDAAEEFKRSMELLNTQYSPKVLGMIANKYSENKEEPRLILREARNSGFRILGDKVWASSSFGKLHSARQSIFTCGYNPKTRKYRVDTQKRAVDAVEEIAADIAAAL